MNLFAVSGLLITISTFFFGCFVYLKNRRRFLNKIWALFNFSAAIWGLGALTIGLTKDEQLALWLWRWTHVGIIFIPIFFYHFVVTFLEFNKNKKKFIVATYISGFIFVILNLNGQLIKNVEWVFGSFYYDGRPATVLYFIFTFLWISLVFYGHYELLKVYSVSSETKRNQIRYFFLATGLGFLGGATCFLVPFGVNLYPYGNLMVPLYPFIMSYAIVRYHLMDIRVVITRTGIFLAVYGSILGMPFILMTLGKTWLIGLLGINWWLAPIILMTTLAAAGPFLYTFLQRRAESLLLREQIHYQESLKQVAVEMTRIHNLEKLLNLIVQAFAKVVQISHFAVYLFDSEEFILKAGHKLAKEQPASVNQASPLIRFIQEQKEPIVYEEMQRRIQETPNFAFQEIEEQMLRLNARVIIPSFSENRLLAFFILGDKRSGKIYTFEDLRIFSVLASQAGLAIENALLYENIEAQVKARTEELAEVQKQLIQAAKLATVGTLAGGVAHEINNPLVAILTNVQMLLTSKDEMDIREIKESLQLIEEAAQRCRAIVKKLMTYARKPLESADALKINLLEIVKKVDSFLAYQLKQEDIQIIIEAKDDNYWVIGNQNELEQVVTNIVLNARDAIKRVKKSGTIYISLSKTANLIKIAIKDEGSGISEKDLSSIFDPFFTTKDVGKGLGLGLSICQSIVEKHRGSITVQSQLNKGATFTVELPEAKEKILPKR